MDSHPQSVFFSLATFTTHSIQLILRMWTYVHLFALASAFFSFQFGSYKSHLSIFFLVIFSFICTFKQFFCVFSWDRKWATEWTNEQTFSSALHTHKCNLRIVESKQLNNLTYVTQAAKKKKKRNEHKMRVIFFVIW